MTVIELMEVLDELHPDAIVCLRSDKGLLPLVEVDEELAVTGCSKVSAMIILTGEVSS